MSTAIVWFRRDLRVHDHPALARAAAEHDRVVPAFVLDDALLDGRFRSPTRAAFLLGCLEELAAALDERGGALAIRRGAPAAVLPELAAEAGAAAVYWASDVSPYAAARDAVVRDACGAAGLAWVQTPGNFIADVSAPRTGAGKPYTVFTPFWKSWRGLPRRGVEAPPARLGTPASVSRGEIPSLRDLGMAAEVQRPPAPGEAAGRALMEEWLDGAVAHYGAHHDRLAGGTSGLSPYLHFGCVSARELEARVTALEGGGPAAFARQLAWRDFYAHVLLLHPANARHEHQERYGGLAFQDDPEALAAWREGRTGFPVVDAAMRQLRATGWMHNRARLVVGSFLTKDLHLDWRHGEAHFMRDLADGDEAQNNGNWQWIASVGVDPAPHFRRIFNPALQQQKFDPGGEYVRRWVPELAAVPDERLAEPWRMSDEDQQAAGCVIGRDYPAPIVDHKRERERALARYRAVAG